MAAQSGDFLRPGAPFDWAIQDRPFLAEDRGRWNRLFLALWGVSLIEVLLAVIQRSVIKIADPYPLSRLEAVLSPRQAALRFFCQIYLEEILYLFFSWIFHNFAKYWMGEAFLGWGRDLDGMYFQISFTSTIAKFPHMKLWRDVID